MTESSDKTSILFVCMGNICRSPTAEGVFRQRVREAGLEHRIEIDSAGTHAYHVGNPPDERAQAAAERRGISLSNLRARRVAEEDFDSFTHIVAMDIDNVESLKEDAEERHHHKIRLFLEFSSGPETEVPDPYYGGRLGFERVFDMVEEASRGLLEDIRTQLLPGGGEVRRA